MAAIHFVLNNDGIVSYHLNTGCPKAMFQAFVIRDGNKFKVILRYLIRFLFCLQQKYLEMEQKGTRMCLDNVG